MKQGTEEWRQARRRGIGGSDAAAVCGLSPWKTPLQVYLDKTGQVEDEETQDMRRGTLLEPAIRQMYCDATGLAVAACEGIITHPTLPFAIASVDGIAEGSRGLECKSSRTRIGWGEPGSQDIPIVYLCQVQHYLMVSTLPVFDVAVLFGDFEFGIYAIEPDAEFHSLLAAREAAFWAMVESRKPPDPTSPEDFVRRWPKAIASGVEATKRDIEIAAVLSAAKAHIKSMEQLKEQLEAQLKASMKDRDTITVAGEALATWKNVNASPKFDAKRFQAEHPDLYSQYLTEPVTQRRFLLKEKCPCLATTTPPMMTLPENLAHLLPPPEQD